jgi:glycine hydroxymethyltransferase
MGTSNYSEIVFGIQLAQVDPPVSVLIQNEKQRQAGKIIMIPSESICPAPVLEALGSAFNNIYAEGYPPSMMASEGEEDINDLDKQLTRYRRYSDRRFYKGCDYVNIIEGLAQRRAARLFATDKNPPENIYVNVQPLSGASANNAVYDAFVESGQTVMGMSLMHGGHLTHGSEFNRSGKTHKIVSYEVDPVTGMLDYGQIMELAVDHRPKMIIAGYTSYPWAPDWKKFRKIADSVGAVLFADVSHPAGMIAAGVYPNPMDHAHVITCTTHKTLFGPRGAVIMTTNADYAEMINQSVFPGEQGGPHVNKFAAMAVAFRIAASKEFRKVQRAIVDNARYLGSVLEENGLKLAYGGTDTHILLIDLNSITTGSGYPLKGEIAVRILDLCGIVANKNTIPGDTITAEASGIRLGTPWITQRGIKKEQLQELGSVIALVLKHIEPFHYEGLTGDLPRGKIELTVLEEAQKRAGDLADQLISEEEVKKAEYPLSADYATTLSKPASYYKGRGVILVKGRRAASFLEGVTTCRITSMDAASPCRSLLLHQNGKLMAPLLIVRLEHEEREDERFVLLCPPENTETVKRWFRGLSDGYLAFDRDDIFKKIEGPVVVYSLEELCRDEKELVMNVIDKTGASAIDLPEFTSDKNVQTQTLFEKYPDCFDLAKPYFIGQKYTAGPHVGVDKRAFSFEEPRNEQKKSVLYDEHLKLTKNFVEFAGWIMPVRYSGILEEHRAVREAAGIFDITHMGVLEVSGKYADHFLDAVCSNYVPWIDVYESQYSYLLNTAGKVIDDIMLYKMSLDRYMIVVNAVNNYKDLAWLHAVNSGEIAIGGAHPHKTLAGKVNIRDLRDPSSGKDRRVNIALQGPHSLNILEKIASSDKTKYSLRRLEKARFLETILGGIDTIVSRTGYTGEEIGFELFVHPSHSPKLWNLFLEAGNEYNLLPAGLGARDSLRIEAGLPLYGHELAGVHDISPLEAGFGPYVKFHKPFFIGRDSLLKKMKESTMTVARFRKEVRGTRMSKQGDFIVSKRTQKVVGTVTSCALDQNGVQVGMAFIDKMSSREGTRIGIFNLTKGGKEKLGDLVMGDRVVLYDDALILSRFPDAEDKN